jgi:hypothetical protein
MNRKTIVLAGAGIVAASALALGGAALASADETGTGTGTGTTNDYGQGAQGAQQGMRAGMGNGNTDPSKPMRSDEKLLTGDTAARVTAAAKAKEPGATIERVETDSDGVYEAHMVRADGSHIIVQIDASFAVTGVQEGGSGGQGGPGGRGMHGDNDADGSTTQQSEPSQSSQSSQSSAGVPSAPATT